MEVRSCHFSTQNIPIVSGILAIKAQVFATQLRDPISQPPSFPSSLTSLPVVTSQSQVHSHPRALQLLLPLPRTLCPTHRDVTLLQISARIVPS